MEQMEELKIKIDFQRTKSGLTLKSFKPAAGADWSGRVMGGAAASQLCRASGGAGDLPWLFCDERAQSSPGPPGQHLPWPEIAPRHLQVFH